MSPGFGVNLVACIRGNIGMGVTARNFARAMDRHGVPFVVVEFAMDRVGGHPVDEFESRIVRDAGELRYPVNLYVLPLPFFGRLFQSCPWLPAPGRMHVVSLWWEASALPPAWTGQLSRFDAVLAASGFLAHVAANGLTLTPVIEMRQPLALPDDVRPDRPRFGLPGDATVFSLSFDPNSDPERKNPVAAIRAFRAAFPAGAENAVLAIRINNAGTDLARSTIEAMRAAAESDGRVRFIDEPLRYEEVLSFYASGDAFVSMHRGEGLGLGLMEAMALGRPVIGTAWSGNMSFMDYTCGCPVRYERKPVAGHWDFLKPEFAGRDAFWADPVLPDAVQWMRRLHEDPAFRARLGAAAKARIAAYQEKAWDGKWLDQLAALWEAQRFLPKAQGKYSTGAPR